MAGFKTRQFVWSFTLVMLAVLGPTSIAAQESDESGLGVEEHLFEPDLIIRHANDIELTDEQKDQLIELADEMDNGMSGLGVGLAMMSISQRLEAILESTQVDEDEAMSTARELLTVETEVKLDHLQLLVRMKNVLTEDQQHILASIKRREAEGRFGNG